MSDMSDAELVTDLEIAAERDFNHSGDWAGKEKYDITHLLEQAASRIKVTSAALIAAQQRAVEAERLLATYKKMYWDINKQYAAHVVALGVPTPTASQGERTP